MSYFDRLKESVTQRFEATPPIVDAAKDGTLVFQVEDAMKARHNVTVLIGKLRQGKLEVGQPFMVTLVDGTAESFPIWEIVIGKAASCRSITAQDSRFPIELGVAIAPEYHDRLPIDRILTTKA